MSDVASAFGVLAFMLEDRLGLVMSITAVQVAATLEVLLVTASCSTKIAQESEGKSRSPMNYCHYDVKLLIPYIS